MKKFLFALIVSLFVTSTSYAAIETFTGTDEYTIGETETQADAKERSRQRALRNAQEQAGIYIRSYSESKDFALVRDEVVTITAGVLKVVGAPDYKVRVLDDGKSMLIITTVTVQIDTDDVDRRLKDFEARHAPKPPVDKPKPIEQPKSVEEPKPEKVEPPTDIDEDKILLSNQKLEEACHLGALRKFKQAIPLCNEALKLNPNNSDAYTYRGHVYQVLGDHVQALKDSTKAIELNPNDAAAWNNRAWAYYEHYKNYKKALADFNKAIELEPNAASYNGRGRVYLALGDKKRANEDFAKAKNAKKI